MKLANLVRNVLLTRKAWISKLMDPRRDIDAECGHPETITTSDYKRMFTRGDVASRVVSLMPEETWKEAPDVYETEDEAETEFELAWQELVEKIPIFTYLQRADILSGIGRYGALLLGFDDGLPLNLPMQRVLTATPDNPGTGEPTQLLYLRPFDETLLEVPTLETDVSSPRYGQPATYRVTFEDMFSGVKQIQEVHWTRMIHLADNRTNSEIYGCPRMEKVFDRLLDLRKISGGSGEMFWKGGFPGISLESQNMEDDVEFDKEATKEQIEGYMNGLQRYIATIGMTAKSLSVQVADPGPHADLQLKLIAVAMGVPWRVLVGSEAAQLASEQDTRAWNARITKRRNEYVNPFILRPFCERLIAAGVLPMPAEGYEVDWPDLNSPTDLDKASVAEKQSNSLAKYVQGGCDVLMPPFHYLTLVLGLSDEEADSVIEAAEEQLANEEDKLIQPPPPPTIVAPPGARGALPAPAGGNGNRFGG